MNHILLEVCVDSVDSALAAEKGGADRIELCSNLIIGGTSPSPLLFKEIRKHTDIPIHVLIRPRFGDFCYSDYEFEIMKGEIELFRDLGAQGVVIGILNKEGELNFDQMKVLVEKAGNMSVTLNRAFDVCHDPFKTLREARTLGINTILTSGQKDSCRNGKGLLRELIEQCDSKIEVLVGAGVTPEIIKEIAPFVKARAYHMSGKITRDSSMVYRKEGVNMGLGEMSEYEILQTDEEVIRQARKILDEM